MHETLKLSYGFDLNLLCKSLVEKLLFFEGEYVTGDDTLLFLQSEPTLLQNLLVDPCLVQVTDHCISMPSVVYCVVYSQMCLIDIPCYLDHIFKGSCWLVVPPNAFLWWNWTNNLGNQKFPSIASDTCWTYANEFNTDLSDWMLPVPLLLLGSGPSFCTVLAMCAHLFRCPYTLCVQISNISMWNKQWG